LTDQSHLEGPLKGVEIQLSMTAPFVLLDFRFTSEGDIAVRDRAIRTSALRHFRRMGADKAFQRLSSRSALP
jgi:hypothetical protein